MMEITADMVKELRQRTGIGVMEREASQGIVHSYIHLEGKLGVLVEVNCESDFVARNEEFKALAKNIAMQIAAANPRFISPDEIPEADLEQEKEIIRGQLQDTKKPPQIIEKIIEGKLKKFYEEVCLMNQPYIKDDKMTVHELIASTIAKFGENIKVRRFARFELGKNS
jgi:elongation factor Ts